MYETFHDHLARNRKLFISVHRIVAMKGNPGVLYLSVDMVKKLESLSLLIIAFIVRPIDQIL